MVRRAIRNSSIPRSAWPIASHGTRFSVTWTVMGQPSYGRWAAPALIHRSRLGGHPHDLDDAVVWCRRALAAAADGDGNGNRQSYADNRAMILVERYERDNSRADLDEALALFEWAVPAIETARRPLPRAGPAGEGRSG